MVLVPQGNEYSYVMMDSPLEDSMFTRLYFMDGHGLTRFRKFSEQESVIRNRIVVWKVDWDGGEKNKVYFVEQAQNETIVPDVADIGVREEATQNQSESDGNSGQSNESIPQGQADTNDTAADAAD